MPNHTGTRLVGTTRAPRGKHQVRVEFKYDGGGLGKGRTVSLFADGKKVGEGRVVATAPIVFSADDGLDVGEDSGARSHRTTDRSVTSSTAASVASSSRFAEGAEAVDHLVSPEQALHIAMSRQ
jgi:hypothetical protein